MQETQRIALFHALKRKDLSKVQALATEDATLLSSPLGNSGLYPIHVAVQEHDFVMIDYFISQHIDLNTAIYAPSYPEHEKTPLYLATELGYIEIIEQLVRVSPKPAHNKEYLLLHAAARIGRLDIIQYLFEAYFDRNFTSLIQTDSTGQTPLHFAARNGHVHILDYYHTISSQMYRAYFGASKEEHKTIFFDSNLSLSVQINAPGTLNHDKTALNLAVEHGHLNCVQMLTENDVTFQPEFEVQRRLIHTAALHGYLKIVQYYVNKYPHVLNETDANGQTPLLWASSAGHTEIVDYLLYLGADFNRGTKGDRNKGKSPLYWAVRGGHTQTVKLLIGAGAIADARIESTSYLLIHVAAQKGHLETSRFLLERYPHWLNETDIYEQTPLLWAASAGHIDVVKYLLSLNPDLDKATSRTGRSEHGKTARDWAAKHGHSVIVDLLDTHRRDAQNRTASHMEDEALKRISHYKPAYINRRPSFFEHASSTFSPSRSLGENLRDFVSPEGQHVVVETLQCDPIKGKKQLEHQVCLMQRAYPDKGFYTSFHFKSTWNSKQNDTGRIVSPYLTGEPADVYLEKIHSIDALVYTLRLITKELVRLHEKGIILNNIKLNKIIISSNHDELNVTYTGFKHARDINDAKAPVAPDTQNRHFAPELVKSSTIFSFQYFSTLKPNYNQDIFSFGHMLNEFLYSHPLGAQAAESFPSMTVFIRKALDITPGNRPTIQSFHESLKSDCLISIQVDDEWEILNECKA